MFACVDQDSEKQTRPDVYRVRFRTVRNLPIRCGPRVSGTPPVAFYMEFHLSRVAHVFSPLAQNGLPRIVAALEGKPVEVVNEIIGKAKAFYFSRFVPISAPGSGREPEKL